MVKRTKQPKGFYRELKSLNCHKTKKLYIVELWLQHKTDHQKDIRFYVKWRTSDELWKAFKFLGSLDKNEYEDHTWMRDISAPRTRKQKAIFKSEMSGIHHLSEIVEQHGFDIKQLADL